VVTFSPASRIFLYLTLIVLVFLSGTFTTDLLLLVLVLIVALRVPGSILGRGLVPISFFVLFTFFSNVLFSYGRVVYEIWGLSFTEEGLRKGGHLSLRLLTLIFGAKVLTATTPADDLVGAMVQLLGPVGRLKPVREFIVTLSLTLRFLPIIYNEAQTLYRDTVRHTSEKGFMVKIRLTASLLSPLFERSLKKARDLSK
jgi:energy-coupling factor transport system permease protein